MDSRRHFFFILLLLLAASCRAAPEATPAGPAAGNDAAVLTAERDNVEHGADEAALAQVLSSVPVSAGEFIRISGGGLSGRRELASGMGEKAE